jgi:GntR family transcriptional regulator/MocR family aminotransferase
VVSTDSYIIEDDYDSEFRFKGIPIPPLQVLSPSRVIYTGTFSKTLFPGLRLGFIIIPGQLLE